MAVLVQVIATVVCLGCLPWVSGQACEDVDATVCQMFRDQRDICVDPCLSKLCPRSCGNCPLKCYHCDAVASVTDCNTTMECSSGQMCIVTETLAADFSKNYRLGCANNDICTQMFGGPSTGGTNLVIGRRSADRRANLDGDCCDSDLCNQHTPSPARRRRQSNVTTTMIMTTTTMMTEEMTTTTIMPTPEPTEPIKPKCSDIDTTGCQRLLSLNKGMCSDPCVVQACPRTCGKCSECYWCNHIKNPEQCNQTTQCDTGEKCYVLETLSNTGQHSYNVGCMHQDVCNQFHAQASHIFGRRADPVELSLDGDCCSGDLCNHHVLMHTTTTTTASPTGTCAYTAADHHCPANFHLVDGKCYMIGNRARTFDDAVNYCKSHCSKLAENLSHGDFRALSHWVTEDYVYIGAKDMHRNGDFVWLTSGKHAATYNYAGIILGLSNTRTCASFHSTGRVPFHAEHCDTTLKPLCQAPMK